MPRVEVRVAPRAKKRRVVVTGKGLKAYVTEPAREGRANRAVIDLVAEHYGVKRSSVRIVKNERGRDKVIEIV